MSDITLRVVEAFPEPEISSLRGEVFADFEQSALLAEVLASESALRAKICCLPSNRFALLPFEEMPSSAGRTGTAKGQTSSACLTRA
jgi:hypothetical protein